MTTDTTNIATSTPSWVGVDAIEEDKPKSTKYTEAIEIIEYLKTCGHPYIVKEFIDRPAAVAMSTKLRNYLKSNECKDGKNYKVYVRMYKLYIENLKFTKPKTPIGVSGKGSTN